MPRKLERSRPNRSERLRRAVLTVFSEPAAETAATLGEFSPSDWRRSLFWLDTSGLALYFADRLLSLRLLDCLPVEISARLEKNLDDNRRRTEILFEECAEISRTFQKGGFPFALLKGFTLAPESVPDNALRHQTDLDFLIREKDATTACKALSVFGYTLHAISGNTWELKAGSSELPEIGKPYKARGARCVELHLLADTSTPGNEHDWLTRAQWRPIRGVTMPALSPADLFLQQAQHLFKHLSGEHTRASWVLEFHRHIATRRSDTAFWETVVAMIESDPHAEMSFGAAALLAAQTFGECALPAAPRRTMERIAPAVRLWVEMYGARTLLANAPGNKLYLLLRRHLHAEHEVRQKALYRFIFPLHLPPRIVNGEGDRRLRSRILRIRLQSWFVFFRLRFHIVEGVRYAIEFSRWQRRLSGIHRELQAS